MQRKVIIAGPLPPPIHGASTINRLIVEAVAAQRPVVCLNLSPSSSRKGIGYHLSRQGRVLKALFAVMSARGVGNGLIHVDGGSGLVYTFALVVAARLRGLRIFLFHHSSRYIFDFSWAMAAILLVAGRKATQIACSASMLDDLGQMYRRDFETMVVPNTVWVPAASERIGACACDQMRLGFLSNLSQQKGLFRAIETLRCIEKRGERAILYIAGTVPASGVIPDFRELTREFGDKIIYLGKVEGEAKKRFFSNIDYFLFPSRYVHETQSLVVPEALSHGIDVVACNHRYVPELIVDSGHVVDDAEAYPEIAARWIIEDHRTRRADDGRKDAIARRYAATHRQAEEALRSLVTSLSR